MLLLTRPRLRDFQTAPTRPVRINWKHPLAAGLVGAWLLNDGTCRDYSAFGNNGGALTGITITPTASGPMQNYGGSGLITVPSASSFQNPLPLSMHFRMAWTTISNTVVFECNGNSGVSVQTSAYQQGTLSLWVGGPSQGVYTTSTWNDGDIHDFLFSFSASGGRSVYVDGVDNSTTSGTPGAPTYASSPLYFGSRNGAYGYIGMLSDVLLWNRSLGADDAAWLAAEPVGMLEPI